MNLHKWDFYSDSMIFASVGTRELHYRYRQNIRGGHLFLALARSRIEAQDVMTAIAARMIEIDRQLWFREGE